MKTRIVQIGNSRGVRLPKALLEEAQLMGEIEPQAAPGRIVIRKASRPRAGWAAAARLMRERNEDQLLNPTTATDFDTKTMEVAVGPKQCHREAMSIYSDLIHPGAAKSAKHDPALSFHQTS